MFTFTVAQVLVVIFMMLIDLVMIGLFTLLVRKHFKMEHPYKRMIPLFISMLLVIPIFNYTALIYDVVKLMSGH